MAEKIIMPQGGQDITEGRVLRWHKAEGDAVKKDEVICEVETEKAVFEVKAPMDGILIKIVVPEGKVARVFSAIGYIGAAGESIADDDEEAAADEKKEAAPKKAASGVDVAALRKKVAARAKGGKGKIKASGRARKLADQHGIDISLIDGSGPKGRIVEKDVQAPYSSWLAA